MYEQREFMKQMFYWRYAQIIFPILIILYHWLHNRISVQTEFLRMYLQIMFALRFLR